MTLLNILIVVAITLLGLIVLLWLLLRYALPWWLARKIAAMANLPQNPGIAARISLIPAGQDWQQPKTAGLVERMSALGFDEIGRFSVPEMPTMQLWAGHHPQDGVVAAIYDHGQMPSFFDIVRVYDDYATCTVSTNPIHDPENVPQGSMCIADPAMTPQTALDTLRAQPVTGHVMVVDADHFSPVFIELYARSIDHILAKKMPDAGKMRQVGARVSEATGQPVPQLDERQMGMAVEMERASRLSALQVAIVDRFLQSGQMDAREWERVRDRVIVVHDLLSREDAADLARSAAEHGISQPVVDEVVAEGLSPLDTFEKIAAALPESQRLRLLGEVDHPLYAQLYAGGF
jgi:hypothetical protein